MMKFVDQILNRMRLSENRRKVVKNVYWAVLGKVVNIVCGLLVGIMVARYLGPEQFGLMNYVISYVTLFSVIAAFGLDGIEIRELSKKGADRNAIMGSAFFLRISFALITILLIFLTVLKFESDKYTFVMVMIYSLSLIFGALNVIRNYFTSIVLNEYVVKSEISRTLIGAVIKAGLLFFHCSLTWFITASVFDAVLVGSGYLYSYHRKAGRLREWRLQRSLVGLLMRESFPLLLSGAAIVVYQKIDAVMIRNMLGNVEVGLFSVAAKVAEMAIFIPIVVSQTIAPLLVKIHQENLALYYKKRQQFLDIMAWSGIVMSVTICLVANPAIRIAYGQSYLSGIPVLQVMAWKTVFVALFSASGQIIVIEHLQRYAVLRNIIGAVISVILNYLLIPVWGIVGSAVATVLAISVSGYFSHFFITPYFYLFPLQTRALCLGWKQIIHPLR